MDCEVEKRGVKLSGKRVGKVMEEVGVKCGVGVKK